MKSTLPVNDGQTEGRNCVMINNTTFKLHHFQTQHMLNGALKYSRRPSLTSHEIKYNHLPNMSCTPHAISEI